MQNNKLEFSLPDNFFYGGAFSANQAEGGFQEGGRGLSNVDVLPLGKDRAEALIGKGVCLERKNDRFYPSDIGIDFYHRYKSDIKLLKDLGINMFKLSICWSRIYPTGEEEKPNAEGIAYYRDIVNELKKNHITPMIELSHYDMPLELIKKYGGWKNRNMIGLFAKYTETMAENFSDVSYWIPIHEVNATVHYPYMAGGVMENEDSHFEQDVLDAIHHQLVAHAKATEIIHRYNPDAMVGMMEGNELMIPATSKPEDRLASVLAANKKFLFMDVLARGYYPTYALKAYGREGLKIPFKDDDMEILKNNTVQFVTFPYYNKFTFCVKMENNEISYIENPNLNPANSYSDATSLRTMLNILYDRYQLPIIIGELAIGRQDILSSGRSTVPKAEVGERYRQESVGGIEDDDRILFLRDHFKAIHDAIEIDGVDCRGALLWEIIDTLSVSRGTISNRFGLIYVDKEDDGTGSLDRKPKKSYYWLQHAIKERKFKIV